MKLKYLINNLKTIYRQKKELWEIKCRQKECAKLYPDWRDDEYNMLECKFLWAYSVNLSEKPSFHTLNAAIVYYNRRTKRYILDIEKYLLDDIGTLRKVFESYASYVASLNMNNNILYSNICGMWDSNTSLTGNCLEEIYLKFKILIQLVENSLIVK